MIPEVPTALVIPVHNRREVTRACLARLRELGVEAWASLIVVDDGSTDGTAEMLGAEFPKVTVLPGNGGLWWAGAIVLGMRHAIAQGARCVVWLNDDCLPDPGSIEVLVRTAHESGGICGALCRGTDGRAVAYAGGWMRGTWPAPLKELPAGTGERLPVEWLHGNLVALPERCWQVLGLPRADRMPHNLADIAYTYAAHRAGLPVFLMPAATALASANDSASYWSWLDPRLGWRELLRGFWNPKVWWYLPGVTWYQLSLFGPRGALALAWLLAKLPLALTCKLLKTTTALGRVQKAL